MPLDIIQNQFTTFWVILLNEQTIQPKDFVENLRGGGGNKIKAHTVISDDMFIYLTHKRS